MIALKRQQFRAKQRQIVLNKLFQQNRMSSLLVFKLDKLEQILTQQHYDSLEYQESIQQIIMMSHNVNLSQLYHLLIQNFIDTIQYQMDVGYYVLSVQVYFMCYFDFNSFNSLDGNGLTAYAGAISQRDRYTIIFSFQ
ncbi:unnamed protein product [Paramecium octaurelia]|uniref:Uncharacterized protein n=1 Tax=Paramecium octaurelia TaxID=43137 RepID=A0A8S1TLJ2_PAROT|nr:unnamed protein product [Paramecium octaurelia]